MNYDIVLLSFVLFITLFTVFFNTAAEVNSFLSVLATAWTNSKLSNMFLQSEDFISWISDRDEQNLCMVLTLVCVKFALIVNYLPTQLNVFAHKVAGMLCTYMGVHSVRMHVGFVLEGSDFVDGAVAIVVLQYSRVCFGGIYCSDGEVS